MEDAGGLSFWKKQNGLDLIICKLGMLFDYVFHRKIFVTGTGPFYVHGCMYVYDMKMVFSSLDSGVANR